MNIRHLDAISRIPAAQWNALTGIDYPFLRHEFLLALEASGCVAPETGWQPRHLLIEDAGRLLAVMPLYLKQHSYGEFVFDHAWADAYHRNGLDYYPKLVNAIPFTPCNGPRIAFEGISPEDLAPLVSSALQQELIRHNASGWHCLFPEPAQSDFWNTQDADHRIACHFHWHNNGYADFEHFLQDCQPRKRKEIKRERRIIADQGITMKRLTGADITPEQISRFYLFYQLTNAKYNGHGGYLSEAFFQDLLRSMPEQMLLVFAYQQDECIAGALNFHSASTLYGRYWGCLQEREMLHFETCFYQGIAFCIENGLTVFDPGAQGEHKIKRGFRPILTQSFHHLVHSQFRSAVRRYLAQEKPAVDSYRAAMAGLLPFKPECPD